MTRPHISLNFAVSADGKITTVSHKASGWTSDADSQRLKQLREGADAIMVGRGTLEADRMTMTAPQNPLRCVISRSGNFDLSHPLFHSDGGPIHLLAEKEFSVDAVNATTHSGSLAGFLETLHLEHRVAQLHCEGGGKLVRELAELDAIDEIHLTWAGHQLFGGKDAPGITGRLGDFLPSSRQFELTHFEPREDLGECFLSYSRATSSSPS